MYGTLDGTVSGLSPCTLNIEKQLSSSCCLDDSGRTALVGSVRCENVAFGLGMVCIGAVGLEWSVVEIVVGTGVVFEAMCLSSDPLPPETPVSED